MSEKKRIVKYEGTLDLAGKIIPCYVLDDGTRVLSGRGMQEAMKMVDDVEDGKETAGTRLTRYLNQKSLKPFIFKGKSADHFVPLICYKGTAKINGFEATRLADLCDGFLEARKNIDLSKRQQIIADECEILIRAFAKVGIIALVDEATGYQYDREKLELQAILKLFISEEILEWQRTFHLGFYKEIFRLWHIPFTKEYIRRKPSFVGHLTNTFVYKNLPKGSFVLQELKKKTPKNEDGDLLVRLHQSLTPFGKEELRKIIYTIESFAAISDSKEKFKRLVQNRYGQTSLDLNIEADEPIRTGKTIDKPTEFDKSLKGLLAVPPERPN